MTETKIVIQKMLIFQSIFRTLLNQYQACLYLFPCISHGDYKYGITIQ